MEKIRIDKWLWSVRIFKSRTIATDACKKGRILIHEIEAKPSQLISINSLIDVKKNGFRFQFKVIKLIEKRVSAPEAAICYINLTPIEELNKYQDWFTGQGTLERRDRGAGRPTKKERREIDRHLWVDMDWDDISETAPENNK
ncbi:MAG: RNA-binding S4 domain-containing protein [Saprospiraceae bacterium]|nr:RNA-binding S4 domain-containing protein [Saprospiraceae bacterium]